MSIGKKSIIPAGLALEGICKIIIVKQIFNLSIIIPFVTHISPEHYDHWDGEYQDTIQNEYNSTYCAQFGNALGNPVGHKLDNDE